MFIQKSKNRIVWQATLGLAAGILLGGGAASLENQVCVNSEQPSSHCLTESPRVRVMEGMVSGAFASGGALLLIELWRRGQPLD
jgi:hypothetical protein